MEILYLAHKTSGSPALSGFLFSETRPAIPEHPVKISDRYYERKGALQLFCALMVATGSTFARCFDNQWINSLHLSFTAKNSLLPTHAGWLDQVEIVFSKLQRDVLTPSYFQEKEDLESQLMDYFEYLNQNPKPIQWSYTKVKMLEKFDPQNQYKLAV